MRNELYDRFCDGDKTPTKPQPVKNDWISTPTNDGDIDGIYRYIGWHMSKAGLSSNCFHYLEVLKQRASQVEAMGPTSAEWRAELDKVMPADFKDWWENSPTDLPIVAATVIRNLREQSDDSDLLTIAYISGYKDGEKRKDADIKELVDALSALYNHTKNNHCIHGLNVRAENALAKHKRNEG